jgi:acyl carrier protein
MPPMEPPIASADVLTIVRSLVADLTERPVSEILPGTNLGEGLGLDSLAMIHLTVSIEERFHVVVPPEASAAERAIVTVADLARWVETLVPARRAS